jgi:hypothetical protein
LFESLEDTIRQGIDTFREVCKAFDKIHDRRLYREKFDSFDEYCRVVWKMSPSKVYRALAAGECVKNLESRQLATPNPIAIPTNEAQARPLTKLTPEQQANVAHKVALKTTKPTARDFEKAAEEETGDKPRITVASKSITTSTTGKPSLESLIELIDEVQTMVKTGKPQAAVLAKLKLAADLATKLNNGRA